MADQDSGADKSFEPTQKKLDDARKKGDLPRSVDLNATAMYLGTILAALLVGGSGLLSFGGILAIFLSKPEELSRAAFEQKSMVLSPIVSESFSKISPFFLLPGFLVLASIIAQRSFVVAPEKLAPKASRLSIIENLKNKFGSRGLFEFAKSTVKLLVFGAILFGYLHLRFESIILTMQDSTHGAIMVKLQYALEFLTIVFVISAAIGSIDFFWQKFEHLKKQRMSHKEIRDEAKESEGDPHLRQARRQRATEIALSTMLSDVPDADVVVVNPTHFAVALKWSRASGSAPECIAKGVDEIAARIRTIATENNVPIHSDPPTARALFASTEIGQEIAPEHYQAVAAAIRFSEAMRIKAKHSWT